MPVGTAREIPRVRRGTCYFPGLPMKTRIGLITSKTTGRTTTTFVEAADAAELAAELTKIGAQRAALYWRDRIGDGHLEGELFPVASLTAAHFEWVSATALVR